MESKTDVKSPVQGFCTLASSPSNPPLWYHVTCTVCQKPLVVHRDWENPPTMHKECASYEIPCQMCSRPIKVRRDWTNPPVICKKCKNSVRLKCESCDHPLPLGSISRFHKRCAPKIPQTAAVVPYAAKEPLRVFLCHSSSDKSTVKKLSWKLRQDGLEPWLDDEKLLPGQDWNLEIGKAVRESHVVLVCLSTIAVGKSGYIQKEIRHALDIADEQPEGTIFLIPLKLDECDVPERLQRWQWVRLFNGDGYSRLIGALRKRAHDLNLAEPHDSGAASAAEIM